MNHAQAQASEPSARFKAHLFERMRIMHREWLKNVQEIRHLEVDYSAKLMSARTAPEAASLCNEWMAKRMAIVVREQEMFANSWVWLIADKSEQPLAAFSKPQDECVG
jgi:TPP-dependent pyruvate/acetoin dehydrogenase alpha subunit